MLCSMTTIIHTCVLNIVKNKLFPGLPNHMGRRTPSRWTWEINLGRHVGNVGVLTLTRLVVVWICALCIAMFHGRNIMKHLNFVHMFGSPADIPEFGFIMTRCVRSPTHNELWRENYRCLRRHFPTAPIVIIDDYSDLTQVDQNFRMTNAAVIYSELPPGKGEILPYYYFYHRRPFYKAVILNDAMLLQRREPLWSAIQSTSDFRYLWYFDDFRDNELEEQLYLISALKAKHQDRLRDLHTRAGLWTGCFSSASIMTWDFVSHLHHTYGLLDMVPAIEGRKDRMGLERVMGLLTADAADRDLTQSPDRWSVFGSILKHRKTGSYHWQDYVHDKAHGDIAEPMVKIWNGRR